MCFNIHKDNKEPYTAQHDISCYKVMYNKRDRDTGEPIPNAYTSHFMSFTYEKGQTYQIEIERTKLWNYDSFLPAALQLPKLNPPGSADTIDKGFHSFTTLDEALRNVDDFAQPRSTRIVSCRIPKGATYYFNPDDEQYVSDQIAIVDDFQPSDEFRRLFIQGDRKSQENPFRLGFRGFSGAGPFFGVAIDPFNLDDPAEDAGTGKNYWAKRARLWL